MMEIPALSMKSNLTFHNGYSWFLGHDAKDKVLADAKDKVLAFDQITS